MLLEVVFRLSDLAEICWHRGINAARLLVLVAGEPISSLEAVAEAPLEEERI